MAQATLNEKDQLRQEKVAETVSKTDQFLRENRKTIYGCLAALLVIGLGVVAYQQFILKPQVKEAVDQMYQAEASFRSGEYELALNGDGNVMGFSQIIDDFGAKGGMDVYLYAGICEFNLGNYQKAIDVLKKYKSKDEIMAARSLACIGDSYVGLGDNKQALSYFEKAAAKVDNIFAATYLFKAGVICEEMMDGAKALTFYKTIKDKYPQSVEGYDIDKYISRIESSSK